MGLLKFVIYFIASLVIMSFLANVIKNPFIIGLIAALVIGFLGAKDD